MYCLGRASIFIFLFIFFKCIWGELIWAEKILMADPDLMLEYAPKIFKMSLLIALRQFNGLIANSTD